MEIVQLPLGQHSYNIHIGAGLLDDSQLLREHVTGSQVFIVSNPTVAPLYLERLQSAFSGLKVDVFLIQDGEAFKTLATLEDVIGGLLECGHNRSTTIVALGGGVVGDTAGFAAASYQRGVNFVQIPTTLLSQVDSSVGGKTAVNHVLGKNMIGAFYQPKAVYIDTDTLSTLPARELSAGLAEVIKHGLLADKNYFEWVDANVEGLLGLDPDKLTSAIKGSCEIKTSVVAEDEKEQGRRALLNFGHTFGHAIETAMGYGNWLHGEAVGAGIVMATDLSWRLGRCSQEEAIRIKRLVDRAKLPVAPPETMDADEFLQMMLKDKKTLDAGMRFVLLKNGPGESELVADVPLDLLKETLNAGSALCGSG